MSVGGDSRYDDKGQIWSSRRPRRIFWIVLLVLSWLPWSCRPPFWLRRPPARENRWLPIALSNHHYIPCRQYHIVKVLVEKNLDISLFKFFPQPLVDCGCHDGNYAAISIRFAVIRAAGYHCGQWILDEVSDARNGVPYNRGLDSFRLFLFSPLPLETGCYSDMTRSASFLSVSSFSKSWLVGSAIYGLVNSRVSRAVDRRVARNNRSGSATPPVVVGRGGRLWRNYGILVSYRGEKRRRKGMSNKERSWFSSTFYV